MAHHNHFVIRNDLSRSLTLNIEPEGAFVTVHPTSGNGLFRAVKSRFLRR